jgi:26S proteasome regulatory subunit N6
VASLAFHLLCLFLTSAVLCCAVAKAALTASRSASTSIYVVPLLQAELDEMSGILHCEEGDVVTAFSYFLESYEALDNANDKRALTVLKYMTLCKILSVSAQSVTQGNSNADANALATAANEVHHLFSGKYALKYGGPDMEAMKAIAGAAEHRSLQEFKDALTAHGQYLKTNHLIAHNLDQLYGNMFESNLLKIIQPYSCVELEHVAKMILLPVDQVARKLAQMILDAKFNGILEQKLGHLIIYDAASADINYTRTLEVIGNMTHVVEALSGRAKRINTTAKADAAAAAVAEKVEAAAAVEKK